MEQQDPPSAQESAYYQLGLSGYNQDVIADGTGGNANTKSTTTIDFSNVYFSEDFVPNSPYGGVADAATYGGGLPADGVVQSATTSAVTYHLAPYDANNVLLLRPLISNTGALNLTTTYKASQLYLLWVGTEAQANNITVTIYFGDGTSQVQTGLIAYDWVGGTTNIALSGLSRVGTGSTQWAALNQFSQSGACKMFERLISITAANQEKEIQSIGFSYTGSGNYQSLAVFGITVFGEPYVLSTPEQSLFSVKVYPNPATDVIRVQAPETVSKIQAFDATGRLAATSASSELNLSGWASGMYFLRIETVPGNIETRKFVKR